MNELIDRLINYKYSIVELDFFYKRLGICIICGDGKILKFDCKN